MARRKSAFLSLGGYYRRLVNYHCRLVNCAFVFAVALLVSILSGQYVFADTHNVTTIRILTNPNNQYSSLNALLANPAGATANDAANVPIIFNLNRNIVYNPINPVIVLTTDTQSNFLYIQHDYNYISIDYPDSNNASMTGGGATPAYTLNINKDGIGTWRLYGDNNGTGTNETFNVNAGMLELFDGSITVNPSGQSGTFNVSGGAAFNVHRSDTNGTTVTAKQGFNFAAGSTIGLDLTNSAGISNPVLTLAGGNLNAANGRTINLLGFSGTGGGAIALDLLRYNYTGAAPVAPETFSAPPLRAVNESKAAPQDAAYDPNLDFMVRGETWNAVVAASGGRLGGTLEQTSTVGANNANTSTISIANYFAQVGTVRWNDGGADDNWNATSSNWTGTGSIAGSETFLHGDNVVFGGAGETVTVQAGGVQIGQIGGNVRNGNGMRAESGEYTFVNDAGSIIGIDGPGGVHVTSLLGAVAPTIVTFQSANSYWGDTVIDTNGQIILQDTAGLGTSNVYLNGGVLTFDTTVADDRFYNEIYGTGGGILEKLGPNMVTLFGDNMSNADTHVTEGSLRNNIGTGVLYVSYDAFYNSSENVNDYGTGTGKSRSIAGLNDGLNDTDPPGFGGTVNMGTKPANDDVILTIDVEQFSRYEFHGQITGGTTPDNGVKVNKRGKGTQIFSSNTVDEGRNNNYTGGTVVYDGYLIAKENLQYDPSDLDTEYRYRTTPFGTGTVTINKPFQNPENSALIFDINHDVTFPDPIPYPPVAVARVGNVFRGDGKVIKRGDAVLSLYGDSRGGTNRIDNYIGRVDVQKGYLRIEHNYALGKAEDITLYGDNPNTAENEKTVLQFLAADSTGGPLGAPTLLPGNTRDNPFDRVITGAGDVEVLENTILYLKGTNDADSVLGPGTVIGDSDYTGKTIVKGGAELIIRNAAGTGNTSAVVMEKGDSAPLPSPSTFTLDFDSADDGAGGQRYDRYITGAGNLQKMGAGAAYLVRENSVSPDNDYTGRTLIKEGVLKIAYAGATGAKDIPPDQNVEISAGAKLELAFDIDETYEKGITGAGSLAKSGSTTATLGGISSYTGGTYIYEGTLSFYNADPLTVGNLGTGGIYFQRGGGILQNRNDVNDLNQDVYIDSDSTATFETLANLTNSQGIYNNNVPGGTRSELVKIGSANLYLNGDAEWTGSTIIKEGWLHNNVPETTDLYVYTGAGYNTGTGTSVGGGRNERTVASIHGENDFSGGTITVVSGTDLVVKYRDKSKKDIFAGTIEGEGGLVFDAEGTTLHLTGGNTYLGSTTIRGVNGTLIGNISTNTSLDIGLSNTYKSDGRDRQIRQLTGFGDVDMQGKSLTIAQNDPSKNPVFSGRILNGYNLNKTGIGSQHLAGNINISSNVEVRNGELILGGLNLNGVDFPATVNIGKDLIVHPKSLSDIPTLTVKKNAAINVGNNFNVQGQLNFDADNSLVEAGSSVTLGKDSILNVTGIGNNDLELIIRSKGAPINDDFGTVTVAGSAPTQDFLVLGVQKSEDKKEIWVGQTLSWYAGNDAHGTFTLQGGSSYYRVGRELHDVSGTFDPAVWDGKTLTKKGEGTLELSRQNTYTGRTVVDDGTLKLTHEKATGGSSGIILSGGTLEIDFDSRDRNGVWSNGLETLISGAGGVRKTGTGYAVLSGNNTYTGRTNVLDGALFIDGKVAGDVYVEERAGLGGNGKIGGNVLLADNSYYLWRFGATERDSDTLTIDGRLSIGQSVFFKPLTTLMSDEQIVNADGWTVIEYGELINRFAGVDSWSNPFYHFELDYDTLGVIKINGYRLDQPRALSDVVVTSAGMAQTKMWRTAFRQIQREWACDCPAAIQQIEANRSGAQFRGQNPATYRTAWMQFVGRGDHFESTYFKDQYSLQSYGAQFGVSLLSTCDHSFGIMFGREEGQLKNKSDKVENEDNYLGLYFAKRFQENVDFLAYIGGGWQKNHLDRFSNERAYAAAFNGSTFNFDFELGKRFYREPGSFLRPYFGVDVEIARLGSGNERTMDGLESNEIRNYGTTKFDQVFLKIGVDANRTWRMVDLYGGVNLNWNVAAPYAKSTIYYPYIDKSIASKSASFGRFSGALNIGLNWYITQRRNSAFYIDYQAEIHQDRKNSISAGTGVVGFFLRF